MLTSLRTDCKKYAKAHTYIMSSPGCELIVTNVDATVPSGGGINCFLSPPFFPEVTGLICLSALSFRINGRFAGALYR
jgi:hypothetical protein